MRVHGVLSACMAKFVQMHFFCFLGTMNILRHEHLLSMIAAPIIWAAHFLGCYVLVSLACMIGWEDRTVFGLNPADIGIALLSAAALVLLCYTCAINYEKYRQAPTDEDGNHDIDGFIALNSVLLSLLSTVALVWVAFPTLMLPTCAI
jgi:hypothetical protein